MENKEQKQQSNSNQKLTMPKIVVKTRGMLWATFFNAIFLSLIALWLYLAPKNYEQVFRSYHVIEYVRGFIYLSLIISLLISLLAIGKLASIRFKAGSLAIAFIIALFMVIIAQTQLYWLYKLLILALLYVLWDITSTVLDQLNYNYQTFFISFLLALVTLMDSIYFANSPSLFTPLFILTITISLFIFSRIIAVWLEFLIEKPKKRFKYAIEKLKGEARWGGLYEFINRDFDQFIERSKDKIINSNMQAPIYLGKSYSPRDCKIGGRHIGLNTDAHMLTIGCTGSGKSRDVLHNNLMTWPHGLLVQDPKGEHVRQSFKRRSAFRDTYVLDPFKIVSDIAVGSNWNPLAEIDPNSDHSIEDAALIADACIVSETGEAQHFSEIARLILQGFIAHVLTAPEFAGQRNLNTVYDLLVMGEPQSAVYNEDAFEITLANMRDNPAMNGIVGLAVQAMDRVGDRELGSFFSTLFRGIKWLQSPAMRNSVEKSDFSLAELRKQDASVYLCLPTEYMQHYPFYMRILVTMALRLCMRTQKPGNANSRVLFMFDEFAQLRTFKPVAEGLSVLRGYNIKLWMLIQHLEQLERYYSDKIQDFISCCDRQYFGIADLKTAKHVSQNLGKFDLTNKLITPAELKEGYNQVQPYQIVIPLAGNPLKLKKVPFYEIWHEKGH